MLAPTDTNGAGFSRASRSGASAMSAHVFHEVYLHVNWHTKGDRPMWLVTWKPGPTRTCASAAGRRVVSFGKKNLPWVLDYVARQREHHASGRVHERLERFSDTPETTDA